MAKGVDFEEFDVTHDYAALEELVEVHGSRTTPTIVVDDRVIMGFDREQLEQIL